jgi:VIT1/CCC1 family predicted Fe2+/Mn2+ transporter
MARTKEFVSHYLREIVFGLEDSIVSTLGAVSGVAVGSGAGETVIMAGLVIVAVEALSMSAGSYLSSKAATEAYTSRATQDATRVLAERTSDDESLRDFFKRKNFKKVEVDIVLKAITRERKIWLREIARGEYRLAATVTEIPLIAAGVMGLFYLAGGVLVVFPYLLLPLEQAFPLAITLGVGTLGALGWVKSLLTGSQPGRSIVEMVLISCVAAAVGIIIGKLFAIA